MRRLLSTATSPALTSDITIVGGGVVGSLLACMISSSPRLASLSLSLVEPRPPPPLQTSPLPASKIDARTYALSPSTVSSLAGVGVWDAISGTGRAQPYQGMHVWDALGPGCLSFGKEGPGGDTLGHLVEHSTLASALWARLKVHEGAGRVTLHEGTDTKALSLPPSPSLPSWPGTAVTQPGDFARVTLASGANLTTRLVVACDGGHSPSRGWAGIGVSSMDYGQTAVVATVELGEGEEEGARGTAWQRFLPLGPVAVLPLWGRYASIVWSTSPSHAAALVAMDGPTFVAALNTVLHSKQSDFVAAAAAAAAAVASGSGMANPCATSGQALGDWAAKVASQMSPSTGSPRTPPTVTHQCSPPLTFPLKLSMAQSYTAPRFALVGDAAHVIHPLAGQGLNAGVRDAAALVGALEARVAGLGEECGGAGLLAEYGGAVAPRNAALAAGVHSISRLFTGGWGGPGSTGAFATAANTPAIHGPGGVLPVMRTLGLAAVAVLPGIQGAFARVAQS